MAPTYKLSNADCSSGLNHSKKYEVSRPMEENVRLTEDRTAWRERSCAAGAANVRTDDVD